MKLLGGLRLEPLHARQVRPETPCHPDDALKYTVDRQRITRFRFSGAFHEETRIHSKGATQ